MHEEQNLKRVILIAENDISRISIILFITGIKLNGPSDSIVVDAHILPLRKEIVRNLRPEIDKIIVGAPTIICPKEGYEVVEMLSPHNY